MNWSNVRLILAREIRDQLRDRRTLFMIAVLPLLLYPLLGMSLFQVRQFMREHSTKVLVLGATGLEEVEPALFDRGPYFSPELFSDPERSKLLEIAFLPDEPGRGGGVEPSAARQQARAAVQAGEYDAALYFPPDFADRLDTVRREMADRVEAGLRPGEKAGKAGAGPSLPGPEIIYSTATERSQLAFARLTDLVERWREAIATKNLEAGGVPVAATKPFEYEKADVADETSFRGAAVWSKILPVMLLLWALTGAFYPAVDLCAGEKERGTLETLLSSPAERSEIVVGKLLTVMAFSMVTAVLNLVAIGMTGWLILSQLPGIGVPHVASIVWLLVALVPVSALFGALCLALAAFARSSKEGQYYLMPLLLVTMPLAVLPMAPGVDLTLGNSLIPVTGVVLLLRTALEGNAWQAVQFLPPVVGVTLGCCLVAIRWAVDQFNSEKVLFRESERLDVGLWLRHLMQDRQPTPTVPAAVFCGVLILVVLFFMSFAMAKVTDFAIGAAVTQLVVVLTPALLMTVVFTSNPLQTLRLTLPKPWWTILLTVPGAVLLAVLLHPVANSLQVAVMKLYPLNESMKKALESALSNVPNVAVLLVVGALMPAICEELAYRGFVLSGLRHLGHKWRAIIYTAIFFGLTHTILQQSIIACLIGVVIGFLAVQSGSILPCMVFHFCHNSLMLLRQQITMETIEQAPLLRWLVVPAGDEGYAYRWPVVAFGAVAAAAVLYLYHRLPFEKSPEEELQESIDRAEAAGEREDDRAEDRVPAHPLGPEAAPCPAPGSEA